MAPCRYCQVRLATAVGGKPFTTNAKPPHAPNFNFNASHEGRYVVLAAEPLHLVGVDVAAPRRLRPGSLAQGPWEAYLAAFRDQLAPSEVRGAVLAGGTAGADVWATRRGLAQGAAALAWVTSIYVRRLAAVHVRDAPVQHDALRLAARSCSEHGSGAERHFLRLWSLKEVSSGAVGAPCLQAAAMQCAQLSVSVMRFWPQGHAAQTFRLSSCASFAASGLAGLHQGSRRRPRLRAAQPCCLCVAAQPSGSRDIPPRHDDD
jgi:hypothetical protein